MKKSFVAIILALTLIVSLCGCSFRGIQKGEDATEPEVTSAERMTLSADEAAMFAQFGISEEDIENAVEYDETPPELVLGEGLIDAEETPVEVELGEDGQPVESESEKNWKQIIEEKKFYMEGVIKADDGTTVPMTLALDGTNFYMQAKVPVDENGGTLTARFLNDGKKLYLMIPAMRCYIVCSEEAVGDIMPSTDEIFAEATYVETTSLKLSGADYICEHYTSETGEMKYYYSDSVLKRIEIIDTEGGATIIDISKITDAPDAKLFKLPAGWIDMTSLLGSDYDISSLS